MPINILNSLTCWENIHLCCVIVCHVVGYLFISVFSYKEFVLLSFLAVFDSGSYFKYFWKKKHVCRHSSFLSMYVCCTYTWISITNFLRFSKLYLNIQFLFAGNTIRLNYLSQSVIILKHKTVFFFQNLAKRILILCAINKGYFSV